jgi:hypothetical protein
LLACCLPLCEYKPYNLSYWTEPIRFPWLRYVYFFNYDAN